VIALNDKQGMGQKQKSNLKQKQLLILSGMILSFFLLAILLFFPSNMNLFANEMSSSKSELNRVYHLEEDGYMLDNGDFVRLSLSFISEDDAGVPKLSRARPFIKNTVTKILSGTERDTFKGSKGLEWFENEIMNDLNQSFSDIDIERVYITGIIIS